MASYSKSSVVGYGVDETRLMKEYIVVAVRTSLAGQLLDKFDNSNPDKQTAATPAIQLPLAD